jgi:predicted GNAT family acetyltransferase
VQIGYETHADHLTVTRTDVRDDLEGCGHGSDLAQGLLETARAEGLAIESRCPFLTHFLLDHADYDDAVWRGDEALEAADAW